MKAKSRKARSTKGWRRRAPKTVGERRALYARCGARAFLDPKRLKFPVVAKTGGCAIDCAGLRAAKSRAAQFRHQKVKGKADRLARRARCTWEH